jgi:hypothetical protein
MNSEVRNDTYLVLYGTTNKPLSFKSNNLLPPNGPALSCGVDNFQYTPNETSSCNKPN